MKKLIAGILVLGLALGVFAFNAAYSATTAVQAQNDEDTPAVLDNDDDQIIGDNEDDNVIGEENAQEAADGDNEDDNMTDDTTTPEGAPRTGHGTL